MTAADENAAAASHPIVQRLTRPYVLEPLRILDEGIAGIDEIDAILRSLGGFSEGPFQRMDRIGLDVEHETTTRVWRALDEPPRLAPHATLQRLIAGNHLGRATQRGFYAYDGPYALPAVPTDRRNFDCPPGIYKAVRLVCDAATTEGGSFTEQYVFARTLIALINEAALLADQQPAAEAQIDELMTTAGGLPRGPLAWAEQIGRHTCATLLRRLRTSSKDQYSPIALWLIT